MGEAIRPGVSSSGIVTPTLGTPRTVEHPADTLTRVITGELQGKDRPHLDAFWSGGISNPIEVIEQITYLLFIRRLDELHTRKENKARRLKEPVEDPTFLPGQDHLR